jgi:hypothetical protein
MLRGLRPSDPLLARIQSMLAALASIFWPDLGALCKEYHTE